MHRSASLALLAALTLGGCATVIDDPVADAISADASEVRARRGAMPMPGDPQTLPRR